MDHPSPAADELAGSPSSRDKDVAARLRAVHLALHRLSSLDSAARLIAAAPREACLAVGIDRAMFSQIRGDRISFVSVSFDADPVMAADFARLARAVRPRVDQCAPEHEAVIRQVPVLVGDAQRAPGVFRPLAHVARTDAYVVAPVIRDGHTVALLHGDRFDSEHPIDELDRELLWIFATGVGWAMNAITQRTDDAAAASAAVPDDEVVAGTVLPAMADGAEPRPARGLALLTSRETEVLQLMSEGASNAAIGEALVISQATVKSHVRHILRKLGAANRTEAVSLFLASAR